MQLSTEYKKKVVNILKKDFYLRDNSSFIQVEAKDLSFNDKYFIIFQQKYIQVYGEEQWNNFISELLEKRQSNIQHNQLLVMLKTQRKLMNIYQNNKK